MSGKEKKSNNRKKPEKPPKKPKVPRPKPDRLHTIEEGE